MGQASRRVYSAELKAEAVRVYHARRAQGVKLAHIARELGVHPVSLTQWVQQQQALGETGDAPLSGKERAELLALRREVETLRLERDFVKKAAAYFARERP
jgi:transposase